MLVGWLSSIPADQTRHLAIKITTLPSVEDLLARHSHILPAQRKIRCWVVVESFGTWTGEILAGRHWREPYLARQRQRLLHITPLHASHDRSAEAYHRGQLHTAEGSQHHEDCPTGLHAKRHDCLVAASTIRDMIKLLEVHDIAWRMSAAYRAFLAIQRQQVLVRAQASVVTDCKVPLVQILSLRCHGHLRSTARCLAASSDVATRRSTMQL